MSPCPRAGVLSILLGLAMSATLPGAEETSGYRQPSAPLAALVDAPLPPTTVLSPDGSRLLLLDRPGAPALAELAQPELRLAGLRLNPATHGRSRDFHYTGLSFLPLSGGPPRPVSGFPAGARIGDFEWSPDGQHVACTVVTAQGLELWLVAVADARARRVTEPCLNGVFGEAMVWLDASSLLIRRVPAGQGPAPVAPAVAAGPIVQENRGRRSGARTYDGLLAGPHDEALFAYYGQCELARVSLDGKVTALPVQGLLSAVRPSPDGQHIIVESLQRPFSYVVPSSRFPVRIEVYDRDGRREHQVAELPLNEATASGAVRPGPRLVSWRADAPATLSWFQDLGRGATQPDKKPAHDGWFTQAAPFAGKPVEQQRFEHRVSSVVWSDDTLALVTETAAATRGVRLWRVAPGTPGASRVLLHEGKSEDRYGDPGRAATVRNRYGRWVLARGSDRKKIYLFGAGASPEGDRPFLDEFDLTTRKSRRIWRSTPPSYEEFGSFLDDRLARALVSRESPSEPLNYYVRDYSTGALTALTHFPNPYPQFAHVTQEVIHYQRADGVALSGTLYLPPGWTRQQGPLPTLLWAYPREFLDADHASQVKATPERFSRVSASGPLPFVLAGYAVLNDPAMPIAAQKGQKPNDTYIEQLVANAQAAVDELVRRGVAKRDRVAVGGHSYGAFMTANLLAHSKLFRAGIARSGAYNRTLTPFGFQSEQRWYWQAPQVYQAMAPFNFAHQIKTPLLLVHGAADDNSGTFPIQSERFYAALKGHGATVRYVVLPHEAHSYRARESLLHVLWEMETWLDANLKR